MIIENSAGDAKGNKAEPRAVPADSVRVARLRERDVAAGIKPEKAMRRLLEFIGSRPLVGYYLEFDVVMINRELWPMLGVRLPQPKIEVSTMYYDYKNRQRPTHERDTMIDLRFQTMMNDLGLSTFDAHDALNDAVMAGPASSSCGVCWPTRDRPRARGLRASAARRA